MNAENRVSYISVNLDSRRNFHSAGPRSARSLSRKSTNISDLQRTSKALDERLQGLENRKMAMEAEKIQEPKINQEAEDLKWLADMQILAGDDYEAKKRVYREQEDADLHPSAAKQKYQSDKSDDVWVDGMLAHGGQKS